MQHGPAHHDAGTDAAIRVCFVSTTSGLAVGGLPTYLRNITAGLATVAPITAVARFGSDGSRGLDYAAAEPRRVLDQGGGVTLTVIAPSPPMRRLAAVAGHLVHHPPLQRLAVALVVRAYAAELARAIPRDVQLVHWVGAGWELLGFAALRVARARGAAFTVLPATHEGSWGDSPLDGRLYAAADRVLALSGPERALLRRLGVAADRIDDATLGPGVEADGDGAAFRARHRLGNRPLVLFIGRKEPYKGFPQLCAAVEGLRRSIPGVALVAIGAPRLGSVEELADEALLDLGPVADPEKADALDACDVLCLASSGESFGIVYIEAWQYGKPVVVGPSPASRDLVEDGVTGIHVAQRPEEIGAALARLLCDPTRARTMGARGRALQRDRYDWPEACKRHVACFERAVATVRE